MKVMRSRLFYWILYLTLFSLARRTLCLRDSQTCGISFLKRKIIGGIDAEGYRYPWFALLVLKDSKKIVPICAGSLITNIHVLTAAHCFPDDSAIKNRNLYDIALGAYDICDEQEMSRKIFSVDEVFIHEKYSKGGKFHDIALVKMSTIALQATICLPLIGVPDLTELALLIGFGSTSETSNTYPCRMLQVNVTKYSAKDCAKTLLPLEDKRERSVICAGSLNGDADSCYGDSGGPLLTQMRDSRYTIVGIVSYGYGCAVKGYPGIYTNVGSYLQWIENKVSLGNSKQTQNNYFTSVKQKDFTLNRKMITSKMHKRKELIFNTTSDSIAFHSSSKKQTQNFRNVSRKITFPQN